MLLKPAEFRAVTRLSIVAWGPSRSCQATSSILACSSTSSLSDSITRISFSLISRWSASVFHWDPSLAAISSIWLLVTALLWMLGPGKQSTNKFDTLMLAQIQIQCCKHWQCCKASQTPFTLGNPITVRQQFTQHVVTCIANASPVTTCNWFHQPLLTEVLSPNGDEANHKHPHCS